MITFSNQIRAFDFLNRDDLTCWHLLSMWLDTKYCAYQKDKKQYMSLLKMAKMKHARNKR